ncbi:MAG: membrane protein [Chloroflexota bacterium]
MIPAARVTPLTRLAAFARGDVLGFVAGTRVGFLVLTYLGIVLIHDARILGTPHVSFTLPLLDHWFHWDSMWYIQIARHGYTDPMWHAQSPTAHFPLFSLLIRDVSVVTSLPDKLVAMALANICFALACLVLYRLCHREFADDGVAWRSVIYLALFPTAFYFCAPYSESLFLLLEVATLDALRRGQWWRAALWGGLAAVTRVPGVLLTLPFAWEYIAQRHRRPRVVGFDVITLLAVPAALGGYMFALQRLTGDPLAFAHHAADWQRSPQWPWQTIWATITAVHRQDVYSFFMAHNLIELGAMALFAGLLVGGVRVLPFSFSLYVLAMLLLVLVTPAQTALPLTSASRYLVVIVPAFMTLAVAGRRPLIHHLYVGVAPGLLALFTILYLNGGWVA